MGKTHPQAATESFPAEPASVPLARHWVRSILVDWGVGTDERQEVELLTTELATNAVLHARTEFQVGVRCEDDRVRVEVCDGTSELPRLRPQWNLDALGGRGLAFVESLSTRAGVERRHPGKAVWFEVGRHRPSQLVG